LSTRRPRSRRCGAPLVHEEFGTNRCTWTLVEGDIDRLFAERRT
jgi:hypothetical protein